MLDNIFFILFGFFVIRRLDIQYQKETNVSFSLFSIIGLVSLYIFLRFPLKYFLDTVDHSYRLTSFALTFFSSLILYLFGMIYYVPLQIKGFKRALSESKEANKQTDVKNTILLKDAVKSALDERDAKKAIATDKGIEKTSE